MQKVVLFISIALVALSCHSGSQQNGDIAAPVKDSTTVQVLDSAYAFGTVTEGEKVAFSFRFKNTGDKPLVIQSARASCGCTKPTWPQEPIPPGATANVRAEFNSQGHLGLAHKLITVYSNARPAIPPFVLTGMVVKKNP
jgi:hypothetical protein